MKVGVLGSGQVAKALGAGFARHGHDVMLGSRSPEKLAEWAPEAGAGVSTGTFAEAAAFGELVVLAVLGSAAEDVLDLAGAENLAGKVVIDTTNPLDHSGDGPPGLFVGFDDSLGERVQRRIRDSRVVKAFNTVGNAYMVDPDLPGGPPTMMIGGDDPAAKATVTEILEDFGWEVSDLGGIDASRVLEPVCIAWVRHGIASGSWDHAFRILSA